MKAFTLILLFAIIIYFPLSVSGQEILLFNPSPSLNAVGSTGTAIPTEDPLGFIWNPAQLGFTSMTNNYSYVFYPSKQISITTFPYSYEINSYAFNLGYNFEDLVRLPLSFGFGYSNVESNVFVNGLFSPVDDHHREYYNTYSFGLCVNYYLQLSAGFSIKDFTSILPEYEGYIIKANRTLNDFGLLLNVPVLRLINKNLTLELGDGEYLNPKFNFSLGYSKSNIGDSIYYFDGGRADPLPRVDKIGYGISTGIEYSTNDFNINVFNFSFTAEAEDVLITWRNYSQWDYQSTLSDLKLWKNVIMLEGDNKIVSRVGLKIDFVETVSLLHGHFQGRDYPSHRRTNGFELRAKGLFKLYALWAKDPITDFLKDHIDIRYYNTDFLQDKSNEIKMSGLVFYIQNINSLFN